MPKGIGISKCGNGHIYIVHSYSGFNVAIYRDRKFYGINTVMGKDSLWGEAYICDKEGTCTPLKELGMYSPGDGFLKSKTLELHAIMALKAKEKRYAAEAKALQKFHLNV